MHQCPGTRSPNRNEYLSAAGRLQMGVSAHRPSDVSGMKGLTPRGLDLPQKPAVAYPRHRPLPPG
eukprot:2204560-Alexandrium_andersonii.AAC.1